MPLHLTSLHLIISTTICFYNLTCSYVVGAMDSNDSFSLAMDSGEMAGFNGLAGGHHGHGPLPPAHPHHGPPGLPHYPEHYDQPGLPQHPVFANCGEKILLITFRK